MGNKDQSDAVLTGAISNQSPLDHGTVKESPSDLNALSSDPGAEPFIPQEQQPGSQANVFLRFARRLDVMLVVLLLLAGAVVIFSVTRKNNANGAEFSADNIFGTVEIPLGEIIAGKDLALSGIANVTVNGTMQLNNGLLLSPSVQPTGAVAGQIYYDQGTNQLAYFNGEVFVFLTSAGETTGGVQSLGGATGLIALGDGIALTNNQINNTGVLSVQGQGGDVSLTAGPGIVINGTNFSNAGVINVAAGTPNVTVANDGSGNVTISVTAPVAGTGTITSLGGTAGTIPLFTASQNIEDSIITQSGLAVTISGDLSVITGGLTLSNALTVSNGGTGTDSLALNGVLVGNGTAAVSSVTAGGAGLCLLSAAGAPAWGVCPSAAAVTSLNGLTGALNIANASAAGSTITLDDASTVNKGIASFNSTNFTVSGGAVNTVQDINSAATPTFAGVNTNTITPSGTLTVGATGQQLILQGNASTQLTATGGGFTTTVGFTGSPTGAVSYNFDRAATTGAYTICTTVGNCVGTGGGVTTLGGTTGTLPKFTGAQTLGDSLLSESGSTMTVNGNLNLVTGSQFQVNGTQISSANLSNDANLAKLSASQTFTGNTVAFQNIVNSTNALNIQNQAGGRVLTVDTTGGQLLLGLASTLDGKVVFSSISNANTVTVLPGTLTGNRTLTLPDASGIICTDSGNCAGAGATLQTGYNFSVGGTTPKIKVNSSLGGVDIQDADTPIGANLFNIRESNGAGLGSVMFGVGNTGQVTLQNATNSTTALRLLTQGGTSVLTGDTTNGAIILGQTGTLSGTLIFNSAGSANATTIAIAAPSAPRTITLPNATGTVCLDSGNCSGGGSTNTLQAAYDAGNTILSSNSRDIQFQLADTATDGNFTIDLQCDTACSGNGRFAIQDDGVDVFTVSPAGGAIAISGALAANGNVVLGDAAADLVTVGGTIQGTNALVFEGSVADGNETTFAITNPTAPRTVTFDDETGVVCLQSSVNCGFLTGSTSDYIQNNTGGPQTANFNITSGAATNLPTARITQVDNSASGGHGLLVVAGSAPGENVFEVRNSSSNQILAVDSNNTRVIVGSNCTNGRLCVGQSTTGTGSSTVINSYNQQSINMTGGTGTWINQNVIMTDTSSAISTTLRPLILDTSTTTNTSATVHSIQVKVPTNAGGNFITLENGPTTILNIANSGAATLQGSLSVSGEISAGSFSGAGLTDCDGTSSKLLWDASTKTFSCGTDKPNIMISKPLDQSVTSSTTMQSDADFTFSIGANETYAFQINAVIKSDVIPGFKTALNAPTGATCNLTVTNQYESNEDVITLCGDVNFIPVTHSDAGEHPYLIWGVVSTGGTGGTVTLRWAQRVSDPAATTIRAQSYLLAYKLTGADLAEAYYTKDRSIAPGDLVRIDGSLKAGVQKTNGAYDSGALGIVSTQPGYVLGDTTAVHGGMPVLLALSGRVPVKVSLENGSIQPGDYLTASSTPGVAMKATKPGQMIGKATEGFNSDNPNANGTVMTFANLTWADPNSGATANSSLQNGTVADLNVSGAMTTKDLVVTGKADIANLVVGTMSVKDITVTGSAIIGGDLNLQGVGKSRNAITKRFMASKHIPIGAVVIIDPVNDGQVTTTAVMADTRVLGVALTEARAGEEVTVAIGGSVQVKAANGTLIQGGDLLVSSSQEGAAEKSASPGVGSMIGKALGKSSDSGELVWVIISLL